jgi:hypothetical protein
MSLEQHGWGIHALRPGADGGGGAGGGAVDDPPHQTGNSDIEEL